MKRVLAAILGSFAIAAAPNWSTTVTQAPNAAFVLGNPKANIRFVEYLSYTCSHCAAFVSEASSPLKKNYVAKALVAVEVRNAVRDRYDFAAALLARCGGAVKFFGNTELLMSAQGQWLAKAPAFDAANSEKMSKLPITDSLKLIAYGLGLDALMKSRGISAAQMEVCLADKAAQQKIVAMTNEAWNERKINGTPAFLINGSPVEGAGHWAVIEPALKAALAAK